MHIEKLAQYLEPIMPEQIRYWLQVRETADPDLKNHIERLIVTTAYKELGEFQKKILLSLPPENKSKGMIHLGKVLYDKEKWGFGISKLELMQHMGIYGRSGAGKTNITFNILELLSEKQIPFLYLDWKRTARNIIPQLNKKVNIYTPGRLLSEFVFNPFMAPPGLEHNIYVNFVIDILSEAFTLGDGAKSILQKAIISCYKITKQPLIKDVIVEVEKIPDKQRIKSWKISTLRALESLDFANVSNNQEITQQEMVKRLLCSNTILELDGLSSNVKKFLIPLLCLWLYSHKLYLKKREELDLVIFIEEAHHVLYRQENRSKESIMNMLLRQSRELGIGIIIIDQHPHLISSAAIGNCYTNIFCNLIDPADVNKAAGIAIIDHEDKHYFSQIPVGQGIVKLQDRWHKPILLQIPLNRIQKGRISDDDFVQYQAIPDGIKLKRFLAHKYGTNLQNNFNSLSSDELRFLDDVIYHPLGGVKERYDRLGLSIGKGNKIKESLAKKGWLESEIFSKGKKRELILRLSRQYQKWVNDDVNIRQESITHAYWKYYYYEKYKNLGYKVQTEAKRHQGRVDLLACNDKETIAIEIETGKSDVIWNIKQNLLSKYDLIIIVATNKDIYQKIEQEIAKSGFILPGRIQLVLQDEDMIS